MWDLGGESCFRKSDLCHPVKPQGAESRPKLKGQLGLASVSALTPRGARVPLAGHSGLVEAATRCWGLMFVWGAHEDCFLFKYTILV